jgi:hypothetical protein
MTTQINGIEITSKMASVIKTWYDARTYDDTMPYVYVSELGEVQDFLCSNLDKFNKSPEIIHAIQIIINIKNDFKQLVPDSETMHNE